MHAVTALQESSQRSIREVVLHLQQMDQLRHVSAFLHDVVGVLLGVGHELLDGFLVSEDTVLVAVFEHTEVRLSGHEQAVLNNIYKAES